MKFSDLFEMPTLINRDLPLSQHRFSNFYSISTIQREFDVVWRQAETLNSHCALISKDHSLAVWGIMTTDPKRDDVEGVEPISVIDFKDELNVKSSIKFNTKNTLQIDLVQTSKRSRSAGIATELYIKLAQSGFTIISDNEQWIGGKQLWKKLAQSVSNVSNITVSVLKDDKMVPYNGSNIPDDEIWSEDNKHKYTLFVLKRS